VIKVALLDLDITVYHVGMSCKNETDWEAVKYTVDMSVNSWITAAGCNRFLGFITDSPTNFRNTTAVTWPYKGHRKEAEKPNWYTEIREYLVDNWNTQLIVGMEADDALAIAQVELNAQGIYTVLVTEDKDLRQVPGLHMTPRRMGVIDTITEAEGHYNLWKQVLTGDKTDNIPGLSEAAYATTTGSHNRWVAEQPITKEEKQKLRKTYASMDLWGPAAACRLLDSSLDYPSDVLTAYIDAYEDMHDEGSWGLGELRFYEVFDLVFMLRECPEHIGMHLNYSEPAIDPEITESFVDF